MISVIIPVYNGGEFILNCYKSLLSQTHKDWEAVFVNDGSTDKTQELLDQLSLKDIRVKSITQDNAGVAVARENGIKASKGEYITFLDVDDEFLPDALSIFQRGFKNPEIDIVIGGMILTHNKKVTNQITYKHRIESGIHLFKDLCTGRIRWQLCAKSFHRNLFHKVSTPSGLIAGEDKAVCLQTAIVANKVYIDSNVVYNYLQQEKSVTHSKNIKISIDTLKSAQFVEYSLRKTILLENELKTYINSMFLLTICSALRCGGEVPEMRTVLNNHFNLKSLQKIPVLKAIAVFIYKRLHINIFSLYHR